MLTIDDPADPRVGAYTFLTDAAARRAREAGEGVFIVEGARSVRRLIGSRWPIRSLLVASERAVNLGDLVDAAQQASAPVYVASREVLGRIAGFPFHRGVLACAGRMELPTPDEVIGSGNVLLIVEGVNDHENLGALFRNAAALGAGGVLLDPTCCDPLYRRSVRVSLGHVLSVPFARLEPWPDGVRDVASAGFTVVALTPSGPDTLDDAGSRIRGPLAILVGSEAGGLSQGALDAASLRTRIPMAPGVDSLNVATAAAIALHHLRAATTG